jgi:flagellar FliJ protein
MARDFRLAGLLRLRQVQQDQAASDLAAANDRARESAARQNRVRATLGGVGVDATSSNVLYAIAAARSSSRSMLAELTAVESRDRAAVDDAAAAYAQARARSLGLEKLETRHNEARTTEDLAAQQSAIDEIASTTSGSPTNGDTQ